jgi:hypothetical protein
MLGILRAVTSNDNEIYRQERPDKQYHGGGDCIVARLKALSLRGGSRACLKLRSIGIVVYQAVTMNNELDTRTQK